MERGLDFPLTEDFTRQRGAAVLKPQLTEKRRQAAALQSAAGEAPLFTKLIAAGRASQDSSQNHFRRAANR